MRMKTKLKNLITGTVCGLLLFTVGCSTNKAKNENGILLKHFSPKEFGSTNPDLNVNDASVEIDYSPDGLPTKFKITSSNVEEINISDGSLIRIYGLLSKASLGSADYKADSLFTGRSVEAGVKDYTFDVSENGVKIIDATGKVIGTLGAEAIKKGMTGGL